MKFNLFRVNFRSSKFCNGLGEEYWKIEARAWFFPIWITYKLTEFSSKEEADEEIARIKRIMLARTEQRIS